MQILGRSRCDSLKEIEKKGCVREEIRGEAIGEQPECLIQGSVKEQNRSGNETDAFNKASHHREDAYVNKKHPGCHRPLDLEP